MNIKQIIDNYIDNEIEVEYYNDDISINIINKFEKEVEVKLPDDYINFALSNNFPISIFVKDEIWEEPSCGDLGPAWTFNRGLFFNSFSKNIHEDFYIPDLSREFNTESELNTIVFMNYSSDQSPFCFKENGKIYQFSSSGYELCEYEESFIDFFTNEIRDLVIRKNEYKKWKVDKSITAPLSVRYL